MAHLPVQDGTARPNCTSMDVTHAATLRARLPNKQVLGIWEDLGFGQVYDDWIRGPLGIRLYT